jgi:serine/threonine protein kinase
VDATPFGHYQLQKLIGRGGMGEVYRAYDTKTDRIVALKVLPLHLAEDATFQQRFRRESQAAAGLNDPHVVPIHGYGEIDGRLYLDMRLIEGRNLGTMLEDSDNPLGAPFAVKVVEQVATALDAAHEAGLIHRDVKPSNVLITDREFVYLIDFGLARTAGEKGLTTAGNTLGTLAYMAPERFRRRADRSSRRHLRADLCALRVHHRFAAVSGGELRAADQGAHVVAAASPVGDRPEAGGVRRRHRQGHGEEAGEAVSDGW